MPTLLQINATANWGSTGKIAEQIGLEVLHRGWDSYLAYGRAAEPSASNLIRIGHKRDIYAHYVHQRIFDSEGLCSKSATRNLLREIERITPDIIHLHNIHDHYLNYKVLFDYLNSCDIPVVWTMHDFWAITGHCMHFVSVGCERFASGCHHCPMRKVYPKSLFDSSADNYALKKELFLGNKNLSIVAVSQWVGQQLRKSFLSRKPIHVIENGIDLTIFKPTYNPISNLFDTDKFVILSVASQWRFDKGLDDYKKLSALLAQDEIIVLVGVDDYIMRDLPSNIIGIKHTSDVSELAALYSRADVVTIFSSAETFGLTVVEGYACGTPAVVYDNTAPPSLITPETGLVVKTHGIYEVYQAICRIRQNGKESYSQACINLAQRKYDKMLSSNRYATLYENLLQPAQ